MTGNPPVDVQKCGQSIWHDNLNRDLIQSGKLQMLIDDYGVLGMTSNPTIFEKAISEGAAYDDTILDTYDLDANEAFDRLSIEDIQHAADLLRPIYDRTNGVDGYVSLEVSPLLANDTKTTLSEARRLFKRVDRPNLMIKIPGTAAGLPAIEEALFDGININITLMFAVANYLDVAERYLRALERRLEAGLPINTIASVASFFLSRIDTMVDKQLESSTRAADKQLLGKAAIASAKIVYKRFKEIFYSPRFDRLRAAGARVQRPLWASTGTKNPAYSDVLYVETLIGPETINTLPEATLKAFKDHGKVASTLEQGIDEAQVTFDRLAEAGIDLDKVTRQLQEDGVKAFSDSFRKLIERIEDKRKLLVNDFMRRQELALGSYRQAVEAEIKSLREQKCVARIWAHDAPLWRTEAEHVKSITSRLGWLTIATDGRIDRQRLRDLRAESRRLGWKHVVLLGMGGSSLAPEVLWKTFGQQDGYPALIVLDSTDPEAVLGVEKAVDLDKTLFIVASKSGTTLETLSMQRYFYAKYAANAGDHFVAITDPGSKLEGWAKDLKFRHTFLNPDDIGGRYSALSYFGMVPAALIGLDFERILETGAEMQQACGANATGSSNPALWIGAIMGVLADQGHNKMTFVTSPEIASFGDWAEQLIAESTGKDGKGIVPVTGAAVGKPSDYGDDRLFVHLRLGSSSGNPDTQMRLFQDAGHPMVTINHRDKYDIGAAFFEWEFATAVAGVVFKINPFNEPNVTESKNNTNRLLDAFKQTGHLPDESPLLSEDGVSLYADTTTAATLQQAPHQLSGMLAAFLGMALPGDYIALMAYLNPTPDHTDTLQLIGRKLRHISRRAVTLGYGPRFLHSTGQLHKGGPNTGLFIQITAADHDDPPIPEAPYGFSILKQAQAAGDLESLRGKGRRVVRLHLSEDSDKGLHKILDAIDAAEKQA